MIDTGPSRFILINAGKYGYGEILVDRPVQLVGANNVGKTTLINALQFLLIDDERQMSFPKPRCPAREDASEVTPSIRSPSLAITYV